jgi:YidC/Oxa1 family membrane protein insertase
MNLDRNSVIGFVLLALLFFGYFFFNSQAQKEHVAQQKRIEDSLAALKPKADPAAVRIDSLRADSSSRVAAAGQFASASLGAEEITVLENNLLKIGFTNKGGQPAFVQLKKYLSADSSPVTLAGSKTDRLSYRINTGPANIAETAELFFATGKVTQQGDSSQSISFVLSDSTGKSITHTYTLKKHEYMVNADITINRADQLIGKKTLDLSWQIKAKQQERDLAGEKRESQLNVYTANEGFDYFTMKDGLSKKFEENVKWVSLKQKFFNHTIIAENGFSYAEMNIKMPGEDDTSHWVADASGDLKLALPAGANATIPLKFYYGPNDYPTLKKYGMEDIVNLGQGIYAFVKYINRLIIMPVFNLFSGFIKSYGLVIALLTIIIRLLTSPLVYTSYLSGAKMKALRPELATLKEKYKDDQQAYSMEQMKLFRTAGVNPLGGCIPALLQIPIFFSLYSFFNAEIDLRGKDFWWSQDLSSYDHIITWGFNIPFIGNHLSLFTILAVVTSLLISIYSMSMTPDQDNPMLKYMPYIFPVMLLGIFNSLPSALTWYYTVSNVITLLLQYVIQNYIINHEKILAQIEENKKKPRSKPKWQDRLESMQDQQRKLEDMKKKTKK